MESNTSSHAKWYKVWHKSELVTVCLNRMTMCQDHGLVTQRLVSKITVQNILLHRITSGTQMDSHFGSCHHYLLFIPFTNCSHPVLETTGCLTLNPIGSFSSMSLLQWPKSPTFQLKQMHCQCETAPYWQYF